VDRILSRFRCLARRIRNSSQSRPPDSGRHSSTLLQPLQGVIYEEALDTRARVASHASDGAPDGQRYVA
jgi:hypothetical protein